MVADSDKDHAPYCSKDCQRSVAKEDVLLECEQSDLLVSRSGKTISITLTKDNVTIVCRLLRKEAKELVVQLKHMLRDD